MTINYQTALWQRLSEHNLVTGEEPEFTEDSAPWYVRTMLGIAGWVSAIFLLSALFSGIAMIVDSALVAGVLGVIACLLAIVIYRMAKQSDFLAQFGFAISLAGQGLLVFSMLKGLQLFEGGEAFISQVRLLALMLAVLQIILFTTIPNFLHRIWSGIIGIGAITFLLIQLGLYPFTITILLAAVAIVWLQEFKWAKYSSMVQALGYSLVFVCFAHLITDNHVLGFSQFWQETFSVTPLGGAWGSSLAAFLSGGVLIAVVGVMLQRMQLEPMSGKGVAALSLALLIAIIGIRTPGITIGLVFVLLGYAHGNKVLLGIGLVTLVVFLSQFYYQLNFTLLQKSLVLFFSGIALLVIRHLMGVFWPQLESNDA